MESTSQAQQVHFPQNAQNALIKLYRGPISIDRHPEDWQALLTHTAAIRNHFAQAGAKVTIVEEHGYAYLSNNEDREEGAPGLVVPRQMSYPMSVICVWLTKKLKLHDAEGHNERLTMHRDRLFADLAPFFPSRNNEVQLINKLDAALTAVEKAGFIDSVPSEPGVFVVRRILEAIFTVDVMNEINYKLDQYMEYGPSYFRERRKRKGAPEESATAATEEEEG